MDGWEWNSRRWLCKAITEKKARPGLLTLPSARAAMTLPRAERDLLMFLASSRVEPSAPVLLTCKQSHAVSLSILSSPVRIKNETQQNIHVDNCFMAPPSSSATHAYAVCRALSSGWDKNFHFQKEWKILNQMNGNNPYLNGNQT